MQVDLDYGMGADSSTIGTSQHFRWLHGIVQWLVVLNLLDGVFTLVWVQYFYADEYNVMLRDLARGDMVLFMAVKLTLVSLGALFLWRNRNHPLAVDVGCRAVIGPESLTGFRVYEGDRVLLVPALKSIENLQAGPIRVDVSHVSYIRMSLP